MPATTIMTMMRSFAAVKKFCTKLDSFTLKQFTTVSNTVKLKERERGWGRGGGGGRGHMSINMWCTVLFRIILFSLNMIQKEKRNNINYSTRKQWNTDRYKCYKC